MINTELFAQMKAKGKYDLPLLLSYSNGAQITKVLKDTGVDVTALKPYNALSETNLRRICEKANWTKAKADEVELILALLDGKEIPITSTVKGQTAVPTKTIPSKKSSCGGNCTCNTTGDKAKIKELEKQISELKLKIQAMELIATVVDTESYNSFKAIVDNPPVDNPPVDNVPIEEATTDTIETKQEVEEPKEVV